MPEIDHIPSTGANRNHNSLRPFTFLLFGLFLSIPAWAQDAQVSGRVTDPSGAVIPNATVGIRNQATSASRSTTTNGDGQYVVPFLSPGTYTVSAEANGFRRLEQTDIKLDVSQRAVVDLKLEVGVAAETVTVTGAEGALSTNPGWVVDSQRILETPLNGRNVQQLITLTPGSVAHQESWQANRASLTSPTSYSVNGGRSSYDRFFVDGADATDFSVKGPAATPSPDAVEEFSVNSSSLTAQYPGPGTTINLGTKSGTNTLHGSLFEFMRNDAFDARAAKALAKPVLRYNQYGFSLGGPTTIPRLYRGKDRTFFFASYQGTRDNQTNPTSIAVPTIAERQGDWSAFRTPLKDPSSGALLTNNIIPQSELSAPALAFQQNYIPLPNAGPNTATWNQSNPLDSDQFDLRLDHYFGSKHRIFGRYARIASSELYLNNPLPVAVSKRATTDNSFVLHDTYTLSATSVNEFSASLLRVMYNAAPDTYFSWAKLGVTMPRADTNVLPGADIQIPGWWGDTGSGTNLTEPRTMERVADTVSLVHGRSQITLGASQEWQRMVSRQAYITDGVMIFQGSFSGNNYTDFLLGKPSEVKQQAPTEPSIQRPAPAFFVQDDFRATSRLTLDIGLRYEPYLAFTEVQNKVSVFRPGQSSTVFPNAPTGLLFAGDPGIPNSITGNRLSNLAPRLGFAYSPTETTTIRSGYGIFYDAPQGVVMEGLLSPFQPWSLSVDFFNPASFSNPYAGQPIPFPYAGPKGAATPFVLPINTGSLPADFQVGYVQQWNLTIEQKLKSNLVLSAAYVGSEGTHLWNPAPLNWAPYIPGASTNANIQSRRPYPNFATINSIETNGTASYQALQVGVNRRVGQGLGIFAHYTFSKSLDEASLDTSSSGTTVPNPGNLSLNRGLSDFNVRHRFLTSFVYRLPVFAARKGPVASVLRGWEATGILTLQSGFPFSVLSGVSNSLSGLSGDRADLIGNPYLSSDRSKAERQAEWFNPAAFAVNAVGTFGTSGRNILTGPGSENLDLGLFRNISLVEGLHLQIRGEFFNALNHVNLGTPNNTVTSPVFGQILSTGSARVVQFALKLVF